MNHAARIVAVMCAYNRRALTLASIESLQAAAAQADLALDVLLVDDCSTDGTPAAVAERFPQVQVLRSAGNLFWNRSMHQGMATALQMDAAYILWLNDDTMLERDALVRLLGLSLELRQRLQQPVIVVGATADQDGRVSYGGSVAAGPWRRMQFRRVWSGTEPLECEGMNGNCVLLPMDLARSVGNLDPVFEHAMGDIDYALRARHAGHRVFAAPGIVGRCSNNPVQGSFMEPAITPSQRWRRILDRKGLPWRSWLHLTRRHGGWLWPAYFCWPYVRTMLAPPRSPRQKAHAISAKPPR